MKKIFLPLIFTILTLFVSCTKVVDEGSLTVNINKGGTLSSKLSVKPYNVEHLTIKGAWLSSLDFYYLRDNMLNLKSLDISNTSTNAIPNDAFNKLTTVLLETILLPNTLKEIGENAFASCYFLKSITIPDKVEKISEGAFLACFSLKTVAVPSSVIEIEQNVFSGCESLETIIFSSVKPPIFEGYFLFKDNISPKIYVPSESVEEYKKVFVGNANNVFPSI